MASFQAIIHRRNSSKQYILSILNQFIIDIFSNLLFTIDTSSFKMNIFNMSGITPFSNPFLTSMCHFLIKSNLQTTCCTFIIQNGNHRSGRQIIFNLKIIRLTQSFIIDRLLKTSWHFTILTILFLPRLIFICREKTMHDFILLIHNSYYRSSQNTNLTSLK